MLMTTVLRSAVPVSVPAFVRVAGRWIVTAYIAASVLHFSAHLAGDLTEFFTLSQVTHSHVH